MAVSHELVLNAVLSFSGIHHADMTGVAVDETTWIHYGQAVQRQKLSITLLAQGDIDMLVPLLATAMILCILEVGDSGYNSGTSDSLSSPSVLTPDLWSPTI